MEIKKYLDAHGFEYQVLNHPPVFTVAEAKQHRQGMEDCIHAKNLFLKDSKMRKYYLVSLEADRIIRLNELRKILEAKKLSFASEVELKEVLDLTPGSVSPMALLNVENKSVDLLYVIDADLWYAPQVAFHPNINTETLLFSGHEFQKVINSFSIQFQVLEFGSSGPN